MAEARCVETNCDGVAVSQGRCVGHLDDDALTAYVGQLDPAGRLDAREATIDETRCRRLTQLLLLVQFTGVGDFAGAQFTGVADFHEVQFGADAIFRGTQFGGEVGFAGAQFSRANFREAQFSGPAHFSEAEFSGEVDFREARFGGEVGFSATRFGGPAHFSEAEFSGEVDFRGARFGGYADFGGAQFSRYYARFGRAQFDDDAGFIGTRFGGYAHFSEAEFSGEVDFRGARFGDYADFGGAQFSRYARFGRAQFTSVADFDGTQFTGIADFGRAQFTGAAGFIGARFTAVVSVDGAQFDRDADFHRAQFGTDAIFRGAQFSREVGFAGAQFTGRANFDEAQFTGRANFREAQFGGDAHFDEGQFSRSARFDEARFSSDAHFGRVRFGRLCVLGPLRVDTLYLSQAVFEGPVAIHAACSTIAAEDIRARDIFALTGRGCDITITGASFDKPARIGSSPATVAFPPPAGQHDEDSPRLLSVQDADMGSVGNVTLAGLDLSACRFVGAYNLDKLHIDGPPKFAETPAGWWWTRRMTLAEERHWRARYDRRSTDWYPLRARLDQVLTLERRALCLDPNPSLPRDPALAFRELADYQWLSPDARDNYWQIREEVTLTHDWLAARTTAAGTDAARVQAAYRELRKSFEDAKNEPGAADFYYGEMEMRRLASRAAPPHRFENALLTAYWAVSGYGLRASRAFLTLLLALALGTVLFATVGFGHTQQTVYVPVRSTTANQSAAYKQTTVPDGKPGFRDAAYYSVQSATSLLREPSNEPLTTIGRITEIALRLLGPLLLGLAVLALRGRVKR